MSTTQHIITRNSTLREALKKLNSLTGNKMTLFVVDDVEQKKILGTLTDGDVRRALLKGISLESSVEEAMFTGFKYLLDNGSDQVDTIRSIRSLGINMIPVINESGRLVDITNLSKISTLLPLSAILMAGGEGERLRPLTLNTPKPLLLIDGKPIIDYNIEALARAGITDITVCTRYLHQQIYEHFSKPLYGIAVKCVKEDLPLGTIGAAALVPHSKGGDTLIMNSDLLTTISLEDLYVKHRDTEADITVGVIPYQVSVPFAILTTHNGKVTGIEEKPSYSHYANAGIYIFKNAVLDAISPGKRLDATDLIRLTIEKGGRVSYYVINGTWIDVGSPTDFRHAEELMRHHRNLSAGN